MRGAMKVIAGCGGSSRISPRRAAPAAAAGVETLDRVTARERVRQRATVDVFEFAADGDAVRDAARLHLPAGDAFREEMRRRFAFHRGIGRENDLAHFTRIE